MQLTPQDIEREEKRSASARRRSTLILIVAFWAFAVLMLSIRALLVDTAPLTVLGPRRLVAAIVGTILCLATAKLLEALRNRSFAERIVWGVASAFVMAVVLTLFTSYLNRVIFPVRELGELNFGESAQWALVWLGYFLAWTGTHLALTYHWESQEHQRRAALLAEMARDAQRAALRYQLNPHFLFNTLNSVAALVGEGRGAEAEAMLVNLATFVRATLTSEPSGVIPLSEEIALQRLYLGIEQARFEERLKVEIDLPEALKNVSVPALILQPLVENAIHHKLAGAEGELTLRIAAAEHGDGIQLSVEDDGVAVSGDGSGAGLGLQNVAARLRAHFGEGGRLDAAPRDGGGYRALIAMPRSPS
ncbi:MAG TPA: histidine kinase [Allosphingosinicella sp.]|nr:histidine kinase [Allosphingosinicella sp.]